MVVSKGCFLWQIFTSWSPPPKNNNNNNNNIFILKKLEILVEHVVLWVFSHLLVSGILHGFVVYVISSCFVAIFCCTIFGCLLGFAFTGTGTTICIWIQLLQVFPLIKNQCVACIIR